jgi:hypothetical protein
MGAPGFRNVLPVESPPHPNPLPTGERGKGSRSPWLSNPEFDSVFQVDVIPENTSVSPLYPLGRGGKGADLHGFQILSLIQYFRSM